MLPKDSPLRNLPKSLDPRQSFYLDAICYCSEMAYLAYSRLTWTLWQVAASGLKHADTDPHSYFVAVFLDAWSVVDSIHRLRQLLIQMPGSKSNRPARQLFLRNTLLVEDMRNVVQHLRNELDFMVQNNYPVWGVVTWIAVRDPQIPSLELCAMVAGKLITNKIPLPNPLGKQFRAQVDHVTLVCKGMQFSISENVRAVETLVKSFEEDLLLRFKDQPAGGPDLFFALSIQGLRRKYSNSRAQGGWSGLK